MLNWELGSVDYWVSLNNKKPFPLTLYQEKNNWKHSAYPHTPLTTNEQQLLETFVEERLQELRSLWSPFMRIRLPWAKFKPKTK